MATNNDARVIQTYFFSSDPNKTNEPVSRPAKWWERIWFFLSTYWKSIFIILTPLIFLPLPILVPKKAFRCLYVILIMACYWVTEVLPLPVTAMIPIVMFPTLGILDSEKTTAAYMKETNMMFMGGLMIAAGVQYSRIPRRVALKTIQLIGCSHRKLNFGLSCVTMLISMWVSNAAATVMMVPIVEAILDVLEQQGLGDIYINKKRLPEPNQNGNSKQKTEASDEEVPIPSDITVCYYLSIAYAASIGGLGTLVGTATNGAFKGIYESDFNDEPPVNFFWFMVYSVPGMIVMQFFTWLTLQFIFMGMFRPKSEAAKKCNLGGAESTAKAVINDQYAALGPMTLHESTAGILFMLAVFLYIFRAPGFIAGWAKACSDLKIRDGAVSMFIVILMFMLPMSADFIKFFKSDVTIAELKSTKAAGGIVTWSILKDKIPWGLLFLLGGGFALAEGSKASGLSIIISESLTGFKGYPPSLILFIIIVVVQFLTEFTSNVAIANIILPVLSQMAAALRIHPLYLMIPATLTCSMAMLMPVGTPPNAIVAGVAHIPTKQMAKGGILPKIVSTLVIWACMPTWGAFVYPETLVDYVPENGTLTIP